MVLIPEVIEAIGGAIPALAAGGIVTGRQMAARLRWVPTARGRVRSG